MSEKGSDDKNASAGARTGPSDRELMSPQIARRRAIMIGCWILGFFVGISLLGFKLGSLFLTFVFLKFTAKEKWRISTAIAVASYLFFWLVFDLGLRVPLGGGLIGEYFSVD